MHMYEEAMKVRGKQIKADRRPLTATENKVHRKPIGSYVPPADGHRTNLGNSPTPGAGLKGNVRMESQSAERVKQIERCFPEDPTMVTGEMPSEM